MSKPEAGQWEAEYKRLAEAVRFAIDYAGGRESEWGDRAEECFRILETAVSRKPIQPSPPPDPDEWVVQDRVPVRQDLDRISWHGNSAACCIRPEVGGPSTGKKHGDPYPDQHPVNRHLKLYVMCRRRDLPPVEQPEPDHVADASKKVSEETELDNLKRHYEHRGRRLEALTKKVRTLRRALTDYKKAQDALERVRLWKWKYGGETRLSETAPSGDWVEVKHDAEGFYTL